MSEVPSIRWGIITTGLISSWFVEDLVLPRSDPKVKHIVQAIGTSAIEKGQQFAEKYCPQSTPTIYASYEEVYNDPNVDVVYIGTPHSFHKQNCLDAIRAGKPILCEKAFTLNAAEAAEVLAAAAEKNVYVHEAMWLRHRPLVHELRRLLFEEKVIGDVFRTVVDFALDVDIPSLPPTSRYRDPALGAGSLLDLGVYALTWAMLTLDPGSPAASERPQILASQTHLHGVEVTTGVLLTYPSSGRQGIVSSTTMMPGDPSHVARIQGTQGYIDVEGPAASMPLSFTVYQKNAPNGTQNEFMPWSETLRVMEIMDEIRRQGGTRYPVDV
ncbi:hypothetical protein BDV26DRAFT_302984 [Aspergillus bertholletiae]|uniref:D-xylose 1-dehydrogenase (NADP(+), D-xylono-1,5-lactone-forming) n=1 Tax=Aspergillus bertholletiae TaxID=1226010 RepID=A0A5N7BNS8_9EURO|nr:hypothetical protein BDV26DRAFT_302984 [Aspergillus bertholletiae]